MPHQLAFRTQAFKKHYQLQFEEDNGIDGRTTAACIGLLHKFARHLTGRVIFPVVDRNDPAVPTLPEKRGRAGQRSALSFPSYGITFHRFIPPLRAQGDWLSKGPAVVHGGQGNGPTGRPASAAWSPGRP